MWTSLGGWQANCFGGQGCKLLQRLKWNKKWFAWTSVGTGQVSPESLLFCVKLWGWYMRVCSSVAWGTYIFVCVCVLVEWKGVWGVEKDGVGGEGGGSIPELCAAIQFILAVTSSLILNKELLWSGLRLSESACFVYFCENERARKHPSTTLCTIIGGNCYKYNFCHNKSFVTTLLFVAAKHIFCCDKSMLVIWPKFCGNKIMFVVMTKSFVMTNICCDKHNSVVTKVLSQQTYFCHDKHVFVATTKHIFCCDKAFVMTNTCLSWQILVTTKMFCCDKHNFVTTSFVMASILLSEQKMCQKYTCGSSCQW